MSSLMHSKVLKGFTGLSWQRTRVRFLTRWHGTIPHSLGIGPYLKIFLRSNSDLPNRGPLPRLICVSIPPTLGLKKSPGQSGQSGFVGDVSDTTRNK
ncbi:hypothetical protein RAB80_011445 [Fusarium oxysporum f. sp. vasinfectum]|nr:hypothetical protein RAB80_011445 [Fusarium oxysporum f. sp. vasinfectum]